MRSSVRILLICSQLFLRSLCFAQTDKIDSLSKLLPLLHDTARIDCLNELSYSYIQILKKDSAEYYAKSAFEEAQYINYFNGIALSLSRKAEIAFRLEGDFARCEALAKESLECYEKTANNKGLDNLYILLWNTTFAQSRYAEAILYAEKRYQLFKNSGNNSAIWDALHMMTIVYKEAGNYEKSFYYNRQAYENAFNYNKPVLPLSLFVFGELYMQIGDYPAALDHFQRGFLLNSPQSKNMLHRSGWDIWIKMEFAEVFSLMKQFDSAWFYYHLFKPSKENEVFNRIYLISTGECYFLQKNFKNALQNFLEGLTLHRKLNDRNQVMRTLLDIAKTYVELGNDSAALKYGKEGLAIALNSKARQFTRDGYKILFTIYDHWRKEDSANHYFRQYTSMSDSVANDQTKARFAAYNYEQQIELMNKEKQINKQQLKIQQQQLQQQSLQKKILIAGVITLFLLSAFIVRSIMLKRRNERKYLNHEIEIQKLESEKTKAELQQQAAELEMQALRAQMNPHFIFNSLNSINMFILENNKLQASEYLSKFSRLVRLILQNSQDAFIPLEKELEALQLYLELESLRFENKFEYKIAVDDDVDTTMLKVPPLIIQPYVENAIWHGLMHKKEKGHLEIELYLNEEILICKITDDGIGRKKAAELKSKSASLNKSMGMRITADRIAMMQQQNQSGTSIKVKDVLADGNPGGTEVLIKIPVSYD
jgi:hypothetical protein